MMRSRSDVAVISRPPSLPSASSAVCWPPDAAVVFGDRVLDPAVQRPDRDVGEPREGAAGLLGRHRARQDARADQEHLLLAEHAQPVEKILVAARLLDGARELGLELGFIRQRAEERRLEQRIHRLRIARQDVGKPRRGAERQRDQRDQIRILLEQREQPRAALQPAEEQIEGVERRVRVLGARQPVEQHRHELGELRAGELAAQRRIGAGQPAAHRGRHLQRLAVAHRAEPVERLAVVGVLGKRQRQLIGPRRGVLEQPEILALHLAQMLDQLLREGVAILEAGKPREALEAFAVRRQRMGLVVGHHLQAVLDGAQETVGGVEIGAGIGADPAAFGERREHRQRLAAAQFGMPAAGDELLGLHEELDLADAAAAELDVVAFDRDVLVAAIGMDLALERLDVGDRGVVEILPPDEGRELLQGSLRRPRCRRRRRAP